MSQESHSNTFDSQLPVDTDTPCLPENRISSLGHHIPSVYSPQHPLVIGNGSRSSVFSAPQRSNLNESKGVDIAPVPNPYERYKHELKRLETFNDWPHSMPVRKEDLARNGFIFLHVGDRTQCVFCRGILSSWEGGDIVGDEHKKNCPECPFAHGYTCGNFPINNNQSFQHLLHQPVVQHALSPPSSLPRPPPPHQHSVYQTNVKIPVQNLPRQPVAKHTVSLPNSKIYGGNITLTSDNAMIATNTNDAIGSLPPLPASGPVSLAGSTNLATTSQPKYPEWKNEEVRIRSFVNWPAQMSQDPRTLANAGLLYMGAGDRAKCYWCGGELYDWEPEDDPMEEHAMWFGHCGYIRMVKGDAYIQHVKDKQNGIDSTPARQDDVFAHPHVLAVLQSGYSREQVQAAFNKYGADKLRDAKSIVIAIRHAQIDSESCGRPGPGAACFPTSDSNMEVEESTSTSHNRKPNLNTQVSFTQQTFPKYAELAGTQVVTEDNMSETATPSRTEYHGVKTSASGTMDPDPSKLKDRDTVLIENERLRDMKLCKICLDHELSITFVPCGHLATCEYCARNLAECPICRKPISEAMRVYWS